MLYTLLTASLYKRADEINKKGLRCDAVWEMNFDTEYKSSFFLLSSFSLSLLFFVFGIKQQLKQVSKVVVPDYRSDFQSSLWSFSQKSKNSKNKASHFLGSVVFYSYVATY
jgi:hypothetical protein